MRTKVMTDEVISSVMNFIAEGKKVPEISNMMYSLRRIKT